MPPQPGVFALPYASTHNVRPDVVHIHHPPVAGPSSRTHGARPPCRSIRPSHSHPPADDPKRDKKRKDLSGKVGKELTDRRDESVSAPFASLSSPHTASRGRHFAENISALHSAAIQLASRPETHPLYNLRMYPLSLERSALLAQLSYEEKHGLAAIETAYEEERERVEDEWRKGRVRVRERLLEGIEERRRRAREEKEGEGAVNGPSPRFPPPALLPSPFQMSLSTPRPVATSPENYATNSARRHLRPHSATARLVSETDA